MSDFTIDISFDSQFGTRGTGNDNFDYPTDCCITDSKIFIVDKQNHRIKIHTLTGTYIDRFGSYGTGDDEFNFPESITTDDTYLYITDSANHRVKIHELDGTFYDEFGEEGTGDDQFNYPIGIDYFDGNLFIADKQNNRIKKHTNKGVYVGEISLITAPSENPNYDLLLPEGVVIVANKIVVADSGNKEVKFFNQSFIYESKTGISLTYPVGLIAGSDDTLIIVDWQNETDSSLYITDSDGVLLDEFGSYGTGNDEFKFPRMGIYYDQQLFIADWANHRIKILDYLSDVEIPIYAERLVNLTKQLYPTGRAWWLKPLGNFFNFHEGLAYSESRAYSASLGLLDSILPDNDNFDATDATNWENALGLFNSSFLTLEERKTIILRKMQYPGDVLARQNYQFIEDQLQEAGFNVYIQPNRFPDGGGGYTVVSPNAAIYGDFNYGDANYGDELIVGATYVANHVDESRDGNFIIGAEDNYKATFFVNAASYPDFADVPEDRKAELRLMLLRLKPAQTVGILLINYT